MARRKQQSRQNGGFAPLLLLPAVAGALAIKKMMGKGKRKQSGGFGLIPVNPMMNMMGPGLLMKAFSSHNTGRFA